MHNEKASEFSRIESSLSPTPHHGEICFFDVSPDEIILDTGKQGYTDPNPQISEETIRHAKFTS
jgi:hypothetical protein